MHPVQALRRAGTEFLKQSSILPSLAMHFVHDVHAYDLRTCDVFDFVDLSCRIVASHGQLAIMYELVADSLFSIYSEGLDQHLRSLVLYHTSF